MRGLTILISILIPFSLLAQIAPMGIGKWTEHLPYSRANSLSAAGDIIYCASSGGMMAYNDRSGEIKRHTTITGLSDVNVTLLKYNPATQSLLIAYKNGNLDILKGDKITNVSAIKNANLTGDKSVNNIRIYGKLAYISTGFGIVVLDMEGSEVKDTYYIGPDSEALAVYDLCIDEGANAIYAATENGIMKASLGDNLSDFNYWSSHEYLPDPGGTYNHIDIYMNKIIANYLTGTYDSDLVYLISDTTFSILEEASYAGTSDFQVESDRLIITKLYNVIGFDENFDEFVRLYTYGNDIGVNSSMSVFHKDLFWIADRETGLVKFVEVGKCVFIAPEGPNTININDVNISKGQLWSTSGILDPDYRFSNNAPEFNHFFQQNWTGLNAANDSRLDSLYGYINIIVNPMKTGQVFSGSWDNGLLELKDGKVYRIYDDGSRAQYGHSLTALEGSGLIRVGGMTYDDGGNLWITTSETPFALNVLKSDGEWQRFNLGAYIDATTIVTDVIVNRNTGHKWIVILASHGGNRIVVYSDGGTIENTADDRIVALSTETGKGDIPGSVVHCIRQDRDGAIWIGTNEGPAVFYSPDQVFESQLNAQQIFVQQEGQTQILLETENIKSICIDGANRKWFGSANSGAYLMSGDGTKQISHFTFENSPLFSNEVNDIEIDGGSGEVFFCTSAGLISYRGSATEGEDNFSNVEVFPNPVVPGYSGLIAVRGLAENANVKFTDAAGLLIYETRANGGQAVWDGRSLSGSRAANGVYLIFCTNSDGTSQEIAKLLFLGN